MDNPDAMIPYTSTETLDGVTFTSLAYVTQVETGLRRVIISVTWDWGAEAGDPHVDQCLGGELVMRARRRGGDPGFSLVELSVSLFITLLVLTLMGVWIMSANRMERYRRGQGSPRPDALSKKDLLVKELRFANGLSPDPAKTNIHVLTFWIDSRTQGTARQARRGHRGVDPVGADQ